MADDAHHEIVIIRRGHHGDHDDHHGGVWKIAFADFMTAMMAFFLVMWLISANDKTRASVARYFNPVRLVDATTQPRGLHDSKKDESGITSTPDTKEADPKDKSKPSQPKPATTDRKGEGEGGRDKRLDATLRESPYVALAEIAGVKGPGEIAQQPKPPTNAQAIGRQGGEAFRDPFAPPRRQVANDDEPGDPVAVTSKLVRGGAETGPGGGAKDARATEDAKPAAPTERDKQGTTSGKLAVGPDARKAETLEREIVAAVQTTGSSTAGPHVDVKRVPEGLLVSLTDTGDFSMFANGSAVPSKRVVLLMDHVAQVLEERPGQVIVRGYTDNKPFHSNRYDNWHLSLDRAQVTHYMLVRGGLSDERIGHVEGYADRAAKHGLDPASPFNRRIEILLKDDPR